MSRGSSKKRFTTNGSGPSTVHQYTPLGQPTSSPIDANDGDTGIRHHWTAFKRRPLPHDLLPRRSRTIWQLERDQETSTPPEEEGDGDSEDEIFEIGSVVLVKHTTALPLLAVITHLWSDEEDERDHIAEGSDDGEEGGEDHVPLSMGLRFFTWAEDLTAGCRERLRAILRPNEVFYQDQSVSLPSSRTSKRSQAAGQSAIEDGFASGPSLTKHAGWSVVRILGSANVFPTQEEAERAAKVNHQAALWHKGRIIPRNLFCRKAAHPRKELFWHIHYPDLVAQGRGGGGWDIKVQEGDARGKGPAEWADHEKKQAQDSGRTLSSEPSTAIPQKSTKPKGKAAQPIKSPLAKRRKMDAPKTSRQRSKGRKQSESDSSEDDEEVSDTSEEEEESDVGSEYSLSHSTSRRKGAKKAGTAGSDKGNDSTSATSAEEEEEEDDEDFDDHDWDKGEGEDASAKRKRKTNAEPSTPRKARSTLPAAVGRPTPRSRRIIDLQRDTRKRLFHRSQGTSSQALLPNPSSSLPSQFASQEELERMTPHERAKRLLHVSTTPSRLPCRTTQAENLLCLLEDSLDTGIGSCIYISGVPGTGKTATVRGVISLLQQRSETGEVNPFDFLEINGMKVADAGETYSLLWSVVGDRGSGAGSGRGKRSPKAALSLLSKHYASNDSGPADDVSQGSGRAITIVLMDELDQLLTSRQDVMYNLFNWPSARDSRLIVVAVANTMDLPERTMSAKVASRLGMTRITFMPYTDKELGEIVRSRLGIDADGKPTTSSAAGVGQPSSAEEETGSGLDDEDGFLFHDDAQRLLSKGDRLRRDTLYRAAVNGCDSIFVNDAITYAAKRISNVSGDARRALDVCRRAVELTEARHQQKLLSTSEVPASASSAATSDPASAPSTIPRITISDIKSVLDGMVKSSKPSHIARSLSLHSKVLLVSLVNLIRKTGLSEVNLSDLAMHHSALCRLHSISSSTAVARGQSSSSNDSSSSSLEPGLTHLHLPLNALVGLGFVIVVGAGYGPGKASGFARVMLVLREDEVRLALEADEDQRVRGML